jgi:hypothetical protein
VQRRVCRMPTAVSGGGLCAPGVAPLVFIASARAVAGCTALKAGQEALGNCICGAGLAGHQGSVRLEIVHEECWV